MNCSEVPEAHLANLIKKRETQTNKKTDWVQALADTVELPTPTPDPYCAVLQVSLEGDSVSFLEKS